MAEMSTATDEWLCQQIVHRTQDAIIFADRDGIIRLWNGGAEVLFGYSADETLGRSLDLIIPERQRPRHWTGYHKVMATGVTRYGRELLAVPALRKDGTRISLEFTIALVRDAQNEVIGAAAILRDVTTRWQQERALRERLAALQAPASHPAEEVPTTREAPDPTPESSHDQVDEQSEQSFPASDAPSWTPVVP